MASKLSPKQILTLISHTAPPRFELFCTKIVTLVFFQDDKPEHVATCEITSILEIRAGVKELGYTLIDEWRGQNEVAYVYAKSS